MFFGLEILLVCVAGVLIGNSAGVLPGIGPMVVLAIFTPVTLSFGNPTLTLVFLSAIYYGSAYGETLSSVLTGVPGEISTAIINDDVIKLTNKGLGQTILTVSATSSFIAGLITSILILLFGSYGSWLLIKLGPAEYTLLLFLALLIPILESKDKVKTISMLSLGSLLGLIGFDVTTGINRLDFNLLEGTRVSIVIFIIGCFGLVSLFDSDSNNKIKDIKLEKNSWKQSILTVPSTLRGTVIGSICGVIPGFNSVISSSISYYIEDNLNKDKLNNISSVEASNNAHHQASFIPLLFLGIPTNGIVMIIMTTLMMVGISPGSSFIQNNNSLFNILITSMLLGNVVLLILNIKLINLWIKLLKTPKYILNTLVVLLCVISTYKLNNSIYDIGLLICFTYMGYYLKKYNYNLIPIMIGLIITPMFEDNLRRTLMIW